MLWMVEINLQRIKKASGRGQIHESFFFPVIWLGHQLIQFSANNPWRNFWCSFCKCLWVQVRPRNQLHQQAYLYTRTITLLRLQTVETLTKSSMAMHTPFNERLIDKRANKYQTKLAQVNQWLLGQSIKLLLIHDSIWFMWITYQTLFTI